MSTVVVSGWLAVDCDVSDATPVQIAVGTPADFKPAFRDWVDGRRVAKIRVPEGPGRVRVFLKVGGAVTDVGVVTL